MTRTLAATGILLGALVGHGCGGRDRSAPTIQLLTPEPGAVAHQHLAISGTSTGGVSRVEIVIDAGAPIVANGTHVWSKTIDVSSLPDGSHAIIARAVAVSGASNDAVTPTSVSFISLAGQLPQTTYFFGRVLDQSNDPVPGATITTVEDPSLSTVADSAGFYALDDLDPAQSYVVHVSGSGHLDMFEPRFSAGQTEQIDLSMFTPAQLAFFTPSGVTEDPAKCAVLGILEDGQTGSGYAGATVSLTPAPPPGDGPFYLDATNHTSLTQPATAQSGAFFAFDVDPDVDLDFTATAGTAQFFTLGTHTGAGATAFLLGASR